MKAILMVHDLARQRDMESMSVAMTPVSGVARPAFFQTPTTSPSILSSFGNYLFAAGTTCQILSLPSLPASLPTFCPVNVL
jgi:hypothetical protein